MFLYGGISIYRQTDTMQNNETQIMEGAVQSMNTNSTFIKEKNWSKDFNELPMGTELVK